MLFLLLPVSAFAFVFGGLAASSHARNGEPWQSFALASAIGFAVMVSMTVLMMH